MSLEDIYFEKFGFGSDYEEPYLYIKINTDTIFVDSMDLRKRMACPVKRKFPKR
jgi:hypothetical protein